MGSIACRRRWCNTISLILKANEIGAYFAPIRLFTEIIMKVKSMLLGLLLGSSAYASYAQELETITVVAPASTNYQVQQYSANEFNDSFRIQETSPGMLSPYLGAFTGNQVDQLVNGIRMSNSYFRSGPNQYFGWIPLQFTRNVAVSDGGNIGGTIARTLGVSDSSVGLSYDGGTTGVETTLTNTNDRFGFGVNEISRGNVRSTNGEVPHSEYNQVAVIAEVFWNDNHQTTLFYSRSDDLERTDKWNGGERITGFRNGSVYNYDLQEYLFLSHNYISDDLQVDLGLQNFVEHILDKTQRVEVEIDVINLNGAYNFSPVLSVYTSNQLEFIDFDVVDIKEASDTYNTHKAGVRYQNDLLTASVGYKLVQISGLDDFAAPEYTVILSRNGYFVSYDHTTNAPSYTSVKQNKTTGRGTVLPNDSLTQEYADTIRIGRQLRNFYFDVYYKQLSDAYNQITLVEDTYQIVNEGSVNAYGASVAYKTIDVFDTGVNIDTRLEWVKATKDIPGTDQREPTSKTAPWIAYIKLDKKGYYAEFRYQPKDNDLAFKDLDDVRIFAHNKGYRIINIGKTGTIGKFEYEIALRNLLNDEARVFGSSVDIPERSVFANVKYIL